MPRDTNQQYRYQFLSTDREPENGGIGLRPRESDRYIVSERAPIERSNERNAFGLWTALKIDESAPTSGFFNHLLGVQWAMTAPAGIAVDAARKDRAG